MNRSKINAVWHRGHKMPQNPSEKQRLTWHSAHAKHCQCWPIPKKLQALIQTKS